VIENELIIEYMHVRMRPELQRYEFYSSIGYLTLIHEYRIGISRLHLVRIHSMLNYLDM
jgi:hypothetical protein